MLMSECLYYRLRKRSIIKIGEKIGGKKVLTSQKEKLVRINILFIMDLSRFLIIYYFPFFQSLSMDCVYINSML